MNYEFLNKNLCQNCNSKFEVNQSLYRCTQCKPNEENQPLELYCDKSACREVISRVTNDISWYTIPQKEFRKLPGFKDPWKQELNTVQFMPVCRAGNFANLKRKQKCLLWGYYLNGGEIGKDDDVSFFIEVGNYS